MMAPSGPRRIVAYIAGAPAVNPATGLPGPREIVSPGFYFPIEELACGAKPAPGKVWIRHENCVCYEVDERALALSRSSDSGISASKDSRQSGLCRPYSPLLHTATSPR